MKSLRRLSALVALCVSPAFAANVTCTNSFPADFNAVQSAINGGGTVNILSGPHCSFGGSKLNFNNGVSLVGIPGTTEIDGAQSQLGQFNSDNVSITGIIWNFGYLAFGGAQYYFNFNFQNNVIENFINATNDGPSALSGPGIVNSVISHNSIKNMWGSGENFPGTPVRQDCGTGNDPLDCWGAGGFKFSGLDNTKIEWNTFDGMANDAVYINWTAMTGKTNPRSPALNNSISYNTVLHERRIPFEIQSQPGDIKACPGNCDYNLVNNNGLKFAGNFVKDYAFPFFQSWGASYVPDGSINGTYMNNTYLATLGAGVNNGFACGSEMSNNNGIIQGNVWASPPGSDPRSAPTSSNLRPYGQGICQGANSAPTFTDTYRNNVFCGNSATIVVDWENKSDPTRLAAIDDKYSYKNGGTCPAGNDITVSNVSITPVSQNGQVLTSGSNGTFSFYVISNLSIRFVNFYVDGSITAAATQELQDVNTNFANDRKWMYHATLGAGLGGGSHTIQAVATDVSGATVQSTLAFSVGASTSPLVGLNPNAVTFGPQPLGVPSTQQIVTLTNIGGVNLTFTPSASPSGDFSWTTTCAGVLTPNGPCTFAVTFTPTAGGTRTGSIVLTDNATGSPHTVTLTGTGAAPSSCIPNPPNLIPAGECDFTTFPTGWGASPGGSSSTFTAGAFGPNGSPGLQIAVSGSPTSNLEVTNDGNTFLPNTSYTLSMAVSMNRPQPFSVLVELQNGTFQNYGLQATATPTQANVFQTLSWSFVTNQFPTAGVGRLALQFPNATVQNSDLINISNVSIVQGASTIVTGLSVDHISHSSARLVFNSSIPYNALRVRYATNDCSTGSITGGGPVDPVPMQTGQFPTTGAIVPITGLTAATTWFACPELSADGGNTFSSGASISFTTTALPAIHPAPPMGPASVDVSYPDTTNAFNYTVAADCSDLMTTAYPQAVGRQLSQITVIKVPAGTVCNAPKYLFNTLPPDVFPWGPSNVNTTTEQVTLGGSPQLVAGQRVIFGRSYAANQTYPASTSCEFGNGLQDGQPYYIATATTGNVVTFNCPDNATPINFTTSGLVLSGSYYWALYPRSLSLKPIVIRSAAPDLNLPPEGVQITSAWTPQMATFQDPLANFGVNDAAHDFIVFGDTDVNVENMIAGIRIGPGIQITTAAAPERLTSSDPLAWFNIVHEPQSTSRIVWDRTLWHFLGTPSRLTNAWEWNGSDKGAVANSFDNLLYFHSEYSGLAATKTGTNTFTVGAGVHNVGQGPINVSGPRTITLSGTGTGRAFAGLDMQNSYAFTIWLPPGETAACSGIGTCVTSTTQYSVGDTSCGNAGKWERDASGQVSVALIACVDISAGLISTVTAADARDSTAGSAEGTAFMTGGKGPGPWTAMFNYVSGAGLMWNHDESGGYTMIRGDIDYFRNYFTSPLQYMYGSSQSDGLSYFQRPPFEIKGGRRIRVRGNIFDGTWNEQTPASVFLLFDSLAGEGLSDVDVICNTFQHGPGVMNWPKVVPGSTSAPSAPVLRSRVKHNLAVDIGNPYYWVQKTGGVTGPAGWFLNGPNGAEDGIIDHNTVLNSMGLMPSVAWGSDMPTEGVSVTNNIFSIDSTTNGLTESANTLANACKGLKGKAWADCKWVNYVWTNNVMIGNGMTQAQVMAAWPVSPNYFPSNESLSAQGWYRHPSTFTLANGNPQSFDYHLNCSGGWCAGLAPAGDGTGPGANIDLLNASQGLLTCCNIGQSANTVSYVAPDLVPCTVDISPTDPNVVVSTIRIVDLGGPRPRTVSIPGLTAKKFYYGAVRCKGFAINSQRFFSIWAH